LYEALCFLFTSIPLAFMNKAPDITPNIAIVLSYTLIGSGYCAVSSILFYTVAENNFLFVIHAAGFLAVCAYFVVVQRTGNMRVANRIILTTGTTVVLSLFATGGWEGTGYFWPFAYLPFAFFLAGKENVTVWVLTLLAGIVAITVLGLLHVITLPYTPILLLNYFAALAIFVTCIFLFQNATIRYQEFLSDSKTAALKKSEARYRSVIEQASDGIFISDNAGRYVDVNTSACKLLGYSREELLTLSVSDLVPAEDLKAKPIQYEHLKVGHAIITERRLIRKDGSLVDVEISSKMLQDGGFQGIARDITERKKTAMALQQLNESLEQRVVERTQLLALANKELEAFSYSVSHDLRAPLRAISGYASMLEEDYETTLDSDAKRLVGIIQGNAKRMGALIDDLLAFSKLGRKEVQKTIIDMNAMTKSVIEELSRSEQALPHIKIANLHAAPADSTLIRQVMINFVSNAFKYSSSTPHAVVEIWSEETPDDIKYAVRDNGTGFDMQYAHKLFGVFQRLHTNEEFEGTGVGLAIVKRIIDKHGGAVRAEGQIGKGATFYFSLPK
jgi:PAS domain S-box-containing protein